MASSKNLKMVAYNTLKRKIMLNELEPNEYLEEKKLCEMLNISRTPIREAISMLEWEQFVQVIPNKGIFVSDISIRMIKELFQVRHMFEPEAARLALPNLDADMLMEYRHRFLDGLERKDYATLHQMDYDFHNDINAACSNKYLTRILNNISDQFQRVRTMSFYTAERTENGAREHLELIHLMLQNESEEVARLMQKHISSTETYFFKSLI